ncbi:MAG: hypothetical protein E4H03_06570, partial [Myxococcales bacterium]
MARFCDVGIGVKIGTRRQEWDSRRAAGAGRIGRRILLALFIAIAMATAMAVGVGACRPRSEAFPLRNNDGTPPNVLLISIDTLRADHLGAYGYRIPTSPAISDLAARGTLFERCLSPASETGPGAASLITGRYQDRHGAWSNVVPLSDDVTTLAEHFSAAGYATAGFVGNRLLGTKFGFDQGFDTFEGFWTDDMDEPSDAEGVRLATEWIADHGESSTKPWFLWLHLMDPHGPYTSTPPSWSNGFEYAPGTFGDDAPVKLAFSNYGLGIIPRYQQIEHERQLSRYVRRYDGEILFTDTQVGRLLAMLEETGLRQRTLIVLSADHGESLTEHEEYLQHGWYVYDTTLRVPLVIAWAGHLMEATAIESPVSTVDVVPTLIELLGLSAPPHSVDGESFAPALLGGSLDPERSLFAFGARANHPFAVSRGRWKLIHTAAGRPP